MNLQRKILKEGIKFHGHLGPFLVLALKAGLFANNVLGKDCFRVYVAIETEPHPPLSCIVDGIQVATGCTLGKRNIELRNRKGPSIAFTKEKKRLKIILKDKVLSDLKNINSKEEYEEKAKTLIKQPIHKLFNIEELKSIS